MTKNNGLPRNTPTVAFATVGCRLNQAETEAISEEFLKHKWEVVDFTNYADVYFINTCTVTGRADRSSRQLIHRARRKQPDALIIAAGCFASLAAEELTKAGEVDLVLGVTEKHTPFKYLPLNVNGRLGKPAVYIHSTSDDLHASVGTRVSGRSRAFLKVQDGCDHSCAYCAVTLARGSSRSVAPNEIRSALKRILSSGFEEVVFTGVDISSWGNDLEKGTGDYTSLVEMAAEEGFPRIRFSSLEPWKVTPGIIARLTSVPQWCEHIHISLQSADERVLESMNRTTDIGSLKESLEEFLIKRPQGTIGADIIAGFTGESQEAHDNTCKFVNEFPLHYLHVFPYSPRPGTPAFSLGNDLSPDIVTQRAKRLRLISTELKLNHYKRSIGNLDDIIVETNGRNGYTRNYLRVTLKSKRQIPLKRVQVKLLELSEDKNSIIAEVIE
ncbi:MAG: tRNA (N(6)-L-threonylcarbamoyladenosine(37)-C(2))-methylthiotransferase MtaB [Candidatus Electryonea clarkiae]|nr:tRNA (N(6)-L-threonylcarbamoyladenosine(37)-C(2))-methylthiotransferase MtaB [Candidatus Electryonea clarkiae]